MKLYRKKPVVIEAVQLTLEQKIEQMAEEYRDADFTLKGK